MTKFDFKELFKIWMFTSFEGATEYDATEVGLVVKRDKLKQKPQMLDEVLT